ncbi:hypothetical protein VT50_0237920 [Streptomyces antioxidans]|uniref:Uncharacterized protein n=1 Tax=Streptomyces antioxidans TaxID=1507734 RepID=A0A1V4CLY3_9ACTN|nr:hypothetical protein VT50_0237920 [Streptomyces antioxidans]
MEWATLASAAAGAVIATASGAFFDRHRWRRERRAHLLEVRRTLYGEYLTCLSKARNAFRLLARDHELGSVERERAARERFASCYELRYQVTITASAPVVEASEETFRRLRDVRDLAAAGVLAGDEAYSGGRGAYEGALTRLRLAMRAELGSDQ